MGRINLSAFRVRRRAIDTYNAKVEPIAGSNRRVARGVLPNWVDIVADIPPAQILTRQQPHQHAVSQIRTRMLPGTNKTQQYAITSNHSQRKSGKASKLFAPVEIKYEEDELRRQFFSDHPWELARPRIVLETTGNQYARVDWSKGLLQPGIPLSGESVVQRQLYLLQNVPEMTIPQSYDIVRQEFYTLRRAEETKRRIAVEEAEHMGAVFNKTANQWSLEIENKMYNDWERWSKEQHLDQMARNSAAAGETMPVEQDALQETTDFERPTDPFLAQERRQAARLAK